MLYLLPTCTRDQDSTSGYSPRCRRKDACLLEEHNLTRSATQFAFSVVIPFRGVSGDRTTAATSCRAWPPGSDEPLRGWDGSSETGRKPVSPTRKPALSFLVIPRGAYVYPGKTEVLLERPPRATLRRFDGVRSPMPEGLDTHLDAWSVVPRLAAPDISLTAFTQCCSVACPADAGPEEASRHSTRKYQGFVGSTASQGAPLEGKIPYEGDGDRPHSLSA